jgi:hypothetical protein
VDERFVELIRKSRSQEKSAGTRKINENCGLRSAERFNENASRLFQLLPFPDFLLVGDSAPHITERFLVSPALLLRLA